MAILMLYLFTTKIPQTNTIKPPQTLSWPVAPVHELRVSPEAEALPPPHGSRGGESQPHTAITGGTEEPQRRAPPPVTLLGPPSARVPTACLPCCLLAALPAARVHFLPSGEAANAGGLRSGMDVGCVTLKMPLDLPEPQFPFQRGVLSVK